MWLLSTVGTLLYEEGSPEFLPCSQSCYAFCPMVLIHNPQTVLGLWWGDVAVILVLHRKLASLSKWWPQAWFSASSSAKQRLGTPTSQVLVYAALPVTRYQNKWMHALLGQYRVPSFPAPLLKRSIYITKPSFLNKLHATCHWCLGSSCTWHIAQSMCYCSFLMTSILYHPMLSAPIPITPFRNNIAYLVPFSVNLSLLFLAVCSSCTFYCCPELSSSHLYMHTLV